MVTSVRQAVRPAWASHGWQRKNPNDPGEARGQKQEPNHVSHCCYKNKQKQLITSCQPKYTKTWCYWVLLHLYLHSQHASYDSSRPLRSKALEGHQIEDSSPTCAVLLIHRHAMSGIPETGRFCRSLHFHRWRVAGRDQMISLKLRMLDHFGPWTAVHLEHAEDTTLRSLVDEAALWRCHTFAHFGSVSADFTEITGLFEEDVKRLEDLQLFWSFEKNTWRSQPRWRKRRPNYQTSRQKRTPQSRQTGRLLPM